jgi:hypothetical protein
MLARLGWALARRDLRAQDAHHYKRFENATSPSECNIKQATEVIMAEQEIITFLRVAQEATAYPVRLRAARQVRRAQQPGNRTRSGQRPLPRTARLAPTGTH